MKEKDFRRTKKDSEKNDLIGGHSPSINNANDNFAVEVLSTNADGTKNVVFLQRNFLTEIFSKLKKSTLFPDFFGVMNKLS
ncbi:hypothetical protein ACFSQ7_36940 [Paenibacillus rhizoplanae]